MSEDSFDDVVLEGKRLVTDDYTRWIIPKSLLNHDSFEDWWFELHQSDESCHASGITRRQRHLLLWLAQLYAELELLTPRTIVEQSKIRSVVRAILQQGMTVKQTAILLGRTERDVVRALYVNQPLDVDAIEARLRLEELLRNGMTDKKAAIQIGLTRSEVRSFRGALGLPAANDRTLPLELRQRAIELRTQGLMPSQIEKIFADEGHTVSNTTISKWWNRYREEGAA